MVDALHEAGIEVLLDVVLNHSGEGDAFGVEDGEEVGDAVLIALSGQGGGFAGAGGAGF